MYASASYCVVRCMGGCMPAIITQGCYAVLYCLFVEGGVL